MENFKASFGDFWIIVKDVWTTGVFGYSVGNALIAVVIFLIFYVFRGLFKRVVSGVLHRWLSKKRIDEKKHLDQILIEALGGPLQLAFVTFGLFFAFQYIGFQGEMGLLADRIIRTLISIAIFWALYDLISPVSNVLTRLERVLTREMIEWLVKGIRWAVIFLGAATILQLWGIQVGPILAGLGLFGVAVALGAQELFRNLIGGLCILLEKQFRKGEWILVEGVVEGTVEHIGFRSTRIRRFDAAPVSVPNMKLSDAAMTNFSRMTARRISWKVPLEYRTSVEQLSHIRAGIEKYLTENEAFVQPPSASLFVRIDSFATSSIDILIYTFTRTTVWGEWLQHKEALLYKIKEIVSEAGADFAFPSQAIFIEEFPKDVARPFLPQAQDQEASDQPPTPNAQS